MAGPPKCRRAGVAYPLYPTLSMGLSIYQLNVHLLLTHLSLLWIWGHCYFNFIVGNFWHSYHTLLSECVCGLYSSTMTMVTSSRRRLARRGRSTKSTLPRHWPQASLSCTGNYRRNSVSLTTALKASSPLRSSLQLCCFAARAVLYVLNKFIAF